MWGGEYAIVLWNAGVVEFEAYADVDLVDDRMHAQGFKRNPRLPGIRETGMKFRLISALIELTALIVTSRARHWL